MLNRNIYGKVELDNTKTKLALGIDPATLDKNSTTVVYVRCTSCDLILLREFCRKHEYHQCHRNGELFYDAFDSYAYESMVGNMVSLQLECKKIHPDAQLPTRKRTTDAGFDVATVESAIVPPHSTVNFKTGLIVSPPPNFYMSVDGRSSLWSKGVVPFRGIIDAGYTGPLCVTLMNISDVPYEVKAGDRIAQLIMHRIMHADFVEVKEFSRTAGGRGEAGFGSSGR